MDAIALPRPCADVIHLGSQLVPLTDFRPEHIDLRGGAAALANQARFTGWTNCGPYSVAQHSVLVSEIARHLARGMVCDERRRLAALWGLLHDWHESVTNDITSPIKQLVRRDTDALDRVATAIDRALCLRLGLPWPLPKWLLALVHHADQVAYVTEVRDVTVGFPIAEGMPNPWPTRIVTQPWHRAMDEWWAHYHELAGPVVGDVVGGAP